MDGFEHGIELWLRLLIAAVLCFVIGYERELRGQDAGDRTFALVGIGCAAFTVGGIDALGQADRVVQGITAGIGFIGGGLLLQSGARVRGLTTAAALWTAAAIGVLAGAGRLLLATLTMVTVLLLLEIQYVPGLRFLDARKTRLGTLSAAQVKQEEAEQATD